MARITIIQGTSKTINLRCLQSDKVTPIDISGGKIYFTVNSDESPADDSSAAIQKTVTSFVDAVNGLATVNLAPSDTSSLTDGDYFYDAKLIESGGTQIAIKNGDFVIEPAVTRSIS